MESLVVTSNFWQNKRILITGHTGFKGVWATQMLIRLGAEVHGFALAPDGDLSLFAMLGEDGFASSTIGDITDRSTVNRVVAETSPQVVLHMAAQSLVRRSYREPVETFSANVMGTVHLLDALRGLNEAEAVLVVTTDKVYENQEDGHAFVESDRLGGHDPYAASKAATEIATVAFNLSYFSSCGVAIATARGGNVIGGGDFSEDRLIPDIIRAEMAGAPLKLRNPQATRPWQHVLDCLAGYLTYLKTLATEHDVPHTLNFGPTNPDDYLTVAEMQRTFSATLNTDLDWEQDTAATPHEMETLAIDSSAAQNLLAWENRYSSSEAIRLTATWYQSWRDGADPRALIDAQISSFLEPDKASLQ